MVTFLGFHSARAFDTAVMDMPAMATKAAMATPVDLKGIEFDILRLPVWC
jgi:hypothetical protein